MPDKSMHQAKPIIENGLKMRSIGFSGITRESPSADLIMLDSTDVENPAVTNEQQDNTHEKNARRSCYPTSI